VSTEETQVKNELVRVTHSLSTWLSQIHSGWKVIIIDLMPRPTVQLCGVKDRIFPSPSASIAVGQRFHSRCCLKGIIMLTASLVILLLAGQTAPKPPPVAIRSAQPSPEYIRSLKITIDKRRKRLAARRRMGERNREAVRQLITAIDRPSNVPFASQPAAVNRYQGSPRRRGDPFRTDLSRSSESDPSFKSCFT
jgi:hypothetical protein